MRQKEVALQCRISRGGFSGERVVLVTTADGSEHVGLAPRDYCWTEGGKPLKPDEPAEGKTIKGLVAARRLEVQDNGVVIVDTPDGETFPVSDSIIRVRPQPETDADVPVRSRS